MFSLKQNDRWILEVKCDMEVIKIDFRERFHYHYLIDFYDYIQNFYAARSLSEIFPSSDLSLRVNDYEIRCHKALLCQESEFFHLMLTTDMLEKEQDSITLKGVTYEAVKCVIEFLYFCKFYVARKDVSEFILAVDMFQIHIMRPVCAELLQKMLSPENLISIYCLASQYRYYDVADEAFGLILEHIKDVTKDSDFLEAPFHLVFKIFKSDCICCEENDLVTSILDWIQFDIMTRHVHLFYLLETVLKSKIHCWKELESRSSMFKPFSTVFDNFCHWIISVKNHTVKYLERRKGRELRKVCVAVGGMPLWKLPDGIFDLILLNLTKKDMEIYVPDLNSFRTSIPYAHKDEEIAPTMQIKHYFPAVAARNRQLYVIGGLTLSNEGSVEVFNSMDNTWKQFPTLPHAIYMAAAVCVDHRIYVCGGSHPPQSGGEVLNNLWYLDTDEDGRPTANSWKEGPPMKYHRRAHALVTINGILFAIGGRNVPYSSGLDEEEGEKLKSVECLLPGKKHWIEMPSLIYGRSHFACVACKNHIFVFDGTICPRDEEMFSVSSLEEFSTEFEIGWRVKYFLDKTPQMFRRATVLNDRLFLVDVRNRKLEMCNPDSLHWHEMAWLKNYRIGMGFITLNLY